MNRSTLRSFVICQTPEELALVERGWLEEVQRRSAEFDAGRSRASQQSKSSGAPAPV